MGNERAGLEPVAEGAGFGIRAVARMLDMAFGQFLGLVAGVAGGVVLVILESIGSVDPGWHTRIQDTSITLIGLGLFGAFGYHFLCEGIYGSTLGKMICRLRVIRMDGSPGTLKGALLRGIAWHIDGLFFGLVGYSSMNNSPLNQRYGDVWGKTVVVKCSQAPETARKSIAWFFLALFLGINYWVVALAWGLVLDGMK